MNHILGFMQRHKLRKAATIEPSQAEQMASPSLNLCSCLQAKADDVNNIPFKEEVL
jgi:hypothetical protein